MNKYKRPPLRHLVNFIYLSVDSEAVYKLLFTQIESDLFLGVIYDSI